MSIGLGPLASFKCTKCGGIKLAVKGSYVKCTECGKRLDKEFKKHVESIGSNKKNV